MRTRKGNPDRQQDSAAEPIQFPDDPAACCGTSPGDERQFDLTCLPESAEQVIEAIDNMSRRLDDLARELKCLGHFDEDDDGPRAA